MLGIEVNGIFLTLAPGTATQIERLSPFFAPDSLSQEASLPLVIPYSPSNAKALGLQNHFYTRRQKLKVPARLWDGNNFCYSGELVLQSARLHLNDITKSSLTGYFLTGVSQFFSAIKGKKLKDLTLGGIRSFAWTGADPLSTAKGFWQIIHQSLAGTLEYSFAPIRNAKWSGSTEAGTPDWMNRLNALNQLDPDNNYNTLAPQVRLQYVLDCVFEEHGWTLDATAMAGTRWDELFMPSFYTVTWQKVVQVQAEPYFAYSPLPTITMDLRNHVPPAYPIANLLIDLRNRYNWGFSFDANAKVCRLFPLKGLAYGNRKDWTKYIAATLDEDFSEDPKIFAFQNEVDGADALSSPPDFEKVQYGTPVVDYAALPPATEAIFNQVVYCWLENQWWQCAYDEDAGQYYWDHFGDGIYNLEPTDHNTSFTTSISTMPMYRTLYRPAGTDYYGLFPLCEQEGNWEGKHGEVVPWNMRLLFHRGWVWEAGPSGAKGQLQYPCLTSVAATITQEEPDLPWSNVYTHPLGDQDLGIVQYWWADSMAYMKNPALAKVTLYLPRPELLQFSFGDVIILRNIPFVAERMADVIPYAGMVEATMRRIG